MVKGSFPVIIDCNKKLKKDNKMKNVILSSLLLVSVLAVSACSSMGTTDSSLSQAPYAEDRTVGTSGSKAPVVRSAAPVFESKQVK